MIPLGNECSEWKPEKFDVNAQFVKSNQKQNAQLSAVRAVLVSNQVHRFGGRRRRGVSVRMRVLVNVHVGPGGC